MLLDSFRQTIYRLRHIVLIAILFFVRYHFSHLSLTELYLSFWNGSFTHYSPPEPLNAYWLYHFEMDHLPIKPYQNPQCIVCIILELANYQLQPTRALNAYCLYHFGMDHLPIKAYQNPQLVLSLTFWNGPFTNCSLSEPSTHISFIILEWTIYQLKPIRTLNVSLSFWNGPFTN